MALRTSVGAGSAPWPAASLASVTCQCAAAREGGGALSRRAPPAKARGAASATIWARGSDASPPAVALVRPGRFAAGSESGRTGGPRSPSARDGTAVAGASVPGGRPETCRSRAGCSPAICGIAPSGKGGVTGRVPAGSGRSRARSFVSCATPSALANKADAGSLVESGGAKSALVASIGPDGASLSGDRCNASGGEPDKSAGRAGQPAAAGSGPKVTGVILPPTPSSAPSSAI